MILMIFTYLTLLKVLKNELYNRNYLIKSSIVAFYKLYSIIESL